MKAGRKHKHFYITPDIHPVSLEPEGVVLECSVRVNANNLDVEPYHDFFYESGIVSAEGDPFAISFGEDVTP